MIRWDPVNARLDALREQGGHVVIATHVNADGDGLGSELGLWFHLAARGHRAWMINNDPVPKKYRFLRGSDRIQVYDEERFGDLVKQAGILFVLDNSSPERLGRMLPAVRASQAHKICIDHHVTVDPFWDLNCVDEEACASGQLVYEMIEASGGAITPEIAEALYVSFVTDTGHFRFSKTTPRVHRIVASLMDTGAISPPRIYRTLFEGVSRGLNRMVAHALADTHYEYGGTLAWARLTRGQMEECHGYDEDTGDLVNMLLAVEGVQASLLFRELPEGRTKVSLRSLGDVDVNRVAARFGGGGHTNASGITMTATLEDAVRRVVEAMKEALPPA